MNQRPIIPGQVGIEVQMQDGPNAVPQGINIPVSGGMKMMIFGGFTKQEQAAVMIAGHLAARNEASVNLDEANDLAWVSRAANELAEIVLAEACAREQRQAERPRPLPSVSTATG